MPTWGTRLLGFDCLGGLPLRLIAPRIVMIFQWPPGVASWTRHYVQPHLTGLTHASALLSRRHDPDAWRSHRLPVQDASHARRGVGSQPATTTYTHPRCGRSAEDGSSRVPLPSGRTPRPFAVRVPRGPHSTPPTVRAGPTPTVVGCSRAARERPPPKGSHLAARNPSATPIRPDPTTLKPRPDSPACFAIATPSPAPRPPSALRSRRLTTFQVQDAGSNSSGTTSRRRRSSCDGVACWTPMGSSSPR
jgi:hypothetical protein